MKRVFFYGLIVLTRIIADIPIFWMFYFLHFQNESSGEVSDAMLNAVLFISWGLFHSLLARNFAKKYIARIVGDDCVRTVFVLIAGLTFAMVLYLWRPLSGVLWHTDGILYWILSILYLSCLVGLFSSMSLIDYADFVGIRTILRSLRNQSAKPQVFSVKGLYAYCRHPMYLLLFIALWMGPIMTYTRLEFAFLGSIYLFIGTFFEERNLREELGEVYDLYRANVPMWIPRFKPWRYE